MYTNVDSFCNKRHELEICIHTYQPDIIGLTEINPKNTNYANITTQDFQLSGYNMYINLAGRGSALYVRESYDSAELNLHNCIDAATWCTMSLNNCDRLIIGTVYRSPNLSDEQNTKLIRMMEEVSKMNSSHLLIMGDLNFPEIDWDNEISRTSIDHPSQNFLECFRDCFLHQHVRQPTHYRGTQKPNILDLVMTNEENMVKNLEFNDPVGMSHHTTLTWTFQCYMRRPVTKVVKYNFEKGNYVEMRRDLEMCQWDEQLEGKPVDVMWDVISKKILFAVEANVPHKFVEAKFSGGRRRPLWMNSRAFAQVRRKKKAFERFRSSKDGTQYLAYVKERNAAKRETRRAVRDYEKSIARKSKKNPQTFFKYANSKLKTRSGVAELQREDGSVTQTDEEKAEVLNRFLAVYILPKI